LGFLIVFIKISLLQNEDKKGDLVS